MMKVPTSLDTYDHVAGRPHLDYDGWREMLCSICGRYKPEGVRPDEFTGWVEVNVYGFTALNIGCNAHRIERTYMDARLDGVDNYVAVFEVAGRSAMTTRAPFLGGGGRSQHLNRPILTHGCARKFT
jgi:hypothetical protein